jgi:hypothetical protein
VANPLQERYAEALLDRISKDRYPSGTYMDMLESVAPPEVLVDYILHLLDRIEGDTYPSIPIMQRVQRQIARFGS